MDYEWHGAERILDVQIEDERLRRPYSVVQRNSRQLAIASIVIGLLTCVFPYVSLVSCVFDGVALVFAFVSITRVLDAEGEAVSGVGTSLELNVITENSDGG